MQPSSPEGAGGGSLTQAKHGSEPKDHSILKQAVKVGKLHHKWSLSQFIPRDALHLPQSSLTLRHTSPLPVCSS